MGKRIDYLDVAKGIGILLVVAGHIYDNELFRITIYSFHMPLFIIISGILISVTSEGKSIFEFIKGKFKSIFIPYIITEIIVLPLYYLKYGYTISDVKWIITDSLFLYYTRGAATWFLLNLFIAEVIYYFVLKLKNKYIIQGLCTILYLLSFINYQENHLVVILLRSFNFVFYLMLGHQFYSKIKKWNIKLMALIPVFLASAIHNGMVLMVDSIYNNVFLYSLSATLGTILIFFVSDVISQKCNKLKVVLMFWGRNSLVVLCTHLIIMRYGIDIVLNDGPLYANLIKAICIFTVVLGAEWLIIKAINRIKEYKKVI